MTREEQLRMKHLDYVSTVIGRMSQSSFAIRGWSVTLVTVIFAILGTSAVSGRGLVLVAFAPAIIFWGLDAYYVRRERLFRLLYADVSRTFVEPAPDHGTARSRGDSPHPPLFDMETARYADRVPGLVRSLFSPHVIAIPVMLTFVITAYVVGTI